MCPLAGSPKIQDLISYILCILQGYVIPLLFAAAFVVFIWGIINFLILGASDEEKRTQGKQVAIWGVIAFTVMLGVWGLVKIVGSTFNLNTSVLPQITPPGSVNNSNRFQTNF